VCWSIVVKEKPTVGSPFLAAFPSDRFSKATKDVGVLFCIHRFTFRDKFVMDGNAAAVKSFCKIYQQIPGNV
jgi:hypothetical protein